MGLKDLIPPSECPICHEFTGVYEWFATKESDLNKTVFHCIDCSYRIHLNHFPGKMMDILRTLFQQGF